MPTGGWLVVSARGLVRVMALGAYDLGDLGSYDFGKCEEVGIAIRYRLVINN